MTDEQAKLYAGALKQWALERITNYQPVSWASDRSVYTAEPDPDKYEGAWRVSGNRSEWHCDAERLRSSIEYADAIVVGD